MRQALNIREHMEVVGSCGMHVGTVDHVEGDEIKLTRNDERAGGQHHYIPVDWVASVDDKVHLRKACDAAVREWSTTPMGSHA